MKGLGSNVTKGLQVGSVIPVCDNSGAKKLKIISVIGSKTRKSRVPSAGVGDLVMGSVKKGKPDMKKQVVYAVIVRQKKEYRRFDGLRVKFEDNSAVILRDEQGNPKGTMMKGPIAKEAAERWSAVSKIASIII